MSNFGTLIQANRNSFEYLNKNDKRMRFNNSQDPIYFVFDYIENKPVTELAKDFVKDTVNDVIKFVSKVTR